jgi:hypothetical protein
MAFQKPIGHDSDLIPALSETKQPQIEHLEGFNHLQSKCSQDWQIFNLLSLKLPIILIYYQCYIKV